MSQNYSHETSGLAFQKMKEKPLHLDNLQMEIAKLLLKENKPMCELEITKLSGIERCSTTARLNKMYNDGIIAEVGKFKSPFSNIKVKHYSLTETGKEYLSPKQLVIFN